MSRGNVDYQQLIRIQKNMQKLVDTDMDEFCEKAAKALAARLLSRVIKRTPVGIYEDGTVGGTLRKGWTSDSHGSAEYSVTFDSDENVNTIVKDLKVNRFGNIFEIEIINPVEYASYVEYGHRTVNHKGWVPGRFMMTISANEVEQLAPNLLEKRLIKLLKGAFEQ